MRRVSTASGSERDFHKWLADRNTRAPARRIESVITYSCRKAEPNGSLNVENL